MKQTPGYQKKAMTSVHTMNKLNLIHCVGVGLVVSVSASYTVGRGFAS